MTLRVLLDAFMNENQIDLENIKLEFCYGLSCSCCLLKCSQLMAAQGEDHGYKIKDPELMDKWRLFHRSYAQYRRLGAAGSCTRSSWPPGVCAQVSFPQMKLWSRSICEKEFIGLSVRPVQLLGANSTRACSRYT